MRPYTQPLLAALAVLMVTGMGGCGRAAEPSPVTASAANVSDIDVAEHVKTALQQNESLKGADITVVSTKGDVLLTGMVASQLQIDDAVRIAKAADGAHAVHNELTLKK